MVGRLDSFWEGLFSGAMLVSGRVMLVVTGMLGRGYIQGILAFDGFFFREKVT